MKLTKETLKRIIKEELESVLEEELDIQAEPHFLEGARGSSKQSFPFHLWNECIRFHSGESDYRNLNEIAYDVAAFLKKHESNYSCWRFGYKNERIYQNYSKAYGKN